MVGEVADCLLATAPACLCGGLGRGAALDDLNDTTGMPVWWSRSCCSSRRPQVANKCALLMPQVPNDATDLMNNDEIMGWDTKTSINDSQPGTTDSTMDMASRLHDAAIASSQSSQGPMMVRDRVRKR